MNKLHERLNKQWNATCRLLFGKEVGELSRYREWLCEGLEPFERRKSYVSGKEVYAVGRYQRGARFISFDEIDYSRKFKPLSINEIKDIDSIIGALGERASYCGNAVLGNSSNVENSTGLEDCNSMLECHTFHKSQDMAYCTIGREVKSSFGSAMIGESSFNIKGHNNWRTSRCLCDFRVYESNDTAYSAYLDGCTECMFCFGIQGKRHMIGNARLEPSKYANIKKKLLSELADELIAKKRLPSLTELVPKTQLKPEKPLPKFASSLTDDGRVQAAFDETCSLILGKKIGNVREYAEYLSQNIRKITTISSAASKQEVYVGGYAIDRQLAESGRAVKLEELFEICREMQWPDGVGQEALSLKEIGKLIEPIAAFCTEENKLATNIIESSTAHYANNILRCSRAYHAKDCAYCCWPRDCDHMFGCDATRNSSFCMDCYNSYKLSRCFEADTSQNCTGCYFIHNCENVHDSMFCFNAKNLKYAVANAEIGRESFLKLKALVTEEIAQSLVKTGDYKRSIYNVVLEKSSILKSRSAPD